MGFWVRHADKRASNRPTEDGSFTASQSSEGPAPLAFQLLLVLIGLGLLPLFAPGRFLQSAAARAVLGSVFLAWALGMLVGLGIAVIAILPALTADDPITALETTISTLTPSAGFIALYLGLSATCFFVSLGSLYVSSRLARGASMFSALYTLVAALSATMSAFTSFLGVQLVFQTENASLFSNWILPLFLSAFVFVFALALWVGGGDAVHTRHWSPGGRGAGSVFLGFFERLTKWVLLAIPACGLFILSTWTSALGLGGKEAVKLHYELEVARLVGECERTVQYTANEDAFLRNLQQTVTNLKTLAEAERSGALSGIAGAGPASTYLLRLTEWLDGLTESAESQITVGRGRGGLEEMRGLCTRESEGFARRFKNIETWNFRRWERLFAADFDQFRATLTDWRDRPTIIAFVETQLAARDLAVSPPALGSGPQADRTRAMLQAYTAQVESRLRDLIAEFGGGPPRPLPANTAWSLADLLPIATPSAPAATESRGTEIAGLQFISARQAILQYAFLAIDIWAFAIAWDFASYALIIIYIFFPGLGRWNVQPT